MTKKYLVRISGEHESLPLAEITALQSLEPEEIDKTTIISQELDFKRLAFSKSAHLVIVEKPIDKADNYLKTTHHEVEEPVRVCVEKPLQKDKYIKQVIRWLDMPKIDLEKAKTTLRLFKFKNSLYITEDFWKNNSFNNRKNQHLPEPHPTAMHPKLARALINIVGAKKEVLDPFCGSAGILLEAGLLGLSTIGVDKDLIMTRRAKINLEHFKIKTEIIHGDALDFNRQVECIVTDLPYGKNSKANELDELFDRFLEQAKKITTKIVVCFPSLVDHQSLVEQSGWKLKQRFDWPLHRSLSKHIYHLDSTNAAQALASSASFLLILTIAHKSC